MADKNSSVVHGIEEPAIKPPTSTSLTVRASLFILFLISSLAVFMFGANYYKLFPTNGNGWYAAILSAIFLFAAVILKRNE